MSVHSLSLRLYPSIKYTPWNANSKLPQGAVILLKGAVNLPQSAVILPQSAVISEAPAQALHWTPAHRMTAQLRPQRSWHAACELLAGSPRQCRR